MSVRFVSLLRSFRLRRRAAALLALGAPALVYARLPEPQPWNNSAPVITAWCRPRFPAALAAERREGNVSVRIIVDDEGTVVEARALQSFDPRADQAALTAIRQWRFRPARVAYLASYCALDVNLFFRLALVNAPLPPTPTLPEMPVEVPKAFPESIFSPDPNYPPELEAERQGGTARVLLLINNKGKVIDTQIINTVEPGFGREAALAARLWTFKPAHQGFLDVPALFEADMIFNAH